MAGDVFFSDNRVWSSNSIGFVDIIRRAIKKCRGGEALVAKILSDAESLRSLGINLQDDRDLQAALTERLLEAAQDDLEELRTNPAAELDEITSIEELVGMAQAHLAGLRSAQKT